MIVGAGLAGLITAHIFQRETIFEAAPGPLEMHHALLRFRSDVVSKVTGIDFREVTVRKGIWSDGRFIEPTIAAANDYTQKCMGRLVGDRSIWNLEPVKRFIAPEDFYDQLIAAVGTRIRWSSEIDFKAAKRHDLFISTAPLPIVMKSLGVDAPFEMEREPITVLRFRVQRSDVHQTVYFPNPNHSLYRASITGDLLICEFSGEPVGQWMEELCAAFRFWNELTILDSVRQSYGKIAPVDNAQRRELLHWLTAEHGILSIGRFATWRNILLDDVVNDAAVVKRLAKASKYERRMAAL